MIIRTSFGGMVLAAALASLTPLGLPAPAIASDGGMGGGGIPNPRGPVYDPNKEFHAGIEALGAGKYRAAKQDFEHVLAMVPNQPTALSMLGQSEAGLGRLNDAARDYEASLRLDPRQIIPARDVAITYEKLGRHDRAQAWLQRIKLRAEACGDSCAEGADLRAAVRDIEAAMSTDSQAANRTAKTPAS